VLQGLTRADQDPQPSSRRGYARRISRSSTGESRRPWAKALSLFPLSRSHLTAGPLRSLVFGRGGFLLAAVALGST
jgi:hypothetical protein